MTKRDRNIFSGCLALVFASVFFWPAATQAVTLPPKFPRLANYYLTPSISPVDAAALARWDVVILGIEHQYTNPSIFKTLRQKNPNIIILAYVLSEEVPTSFLALTDPNHPTYKLYQAVPESWYLHTTAGARTGFWPGANMLNVTNSAASIDGERWNTYLPKFMHQTVMSTGLWDGIYYDNMFNDVSWVNGGNIDTDNNGVADSAGSVDPGWRDGMQTMLDLSRKLEGNTAVIIGNGGGQYYPAVNGRLIEEFPSDLDGGWTGATQKYFDVLHRGLSPALVILNGKTTNGMENDYQSMRYVLSTTLLGNGFFSFDYGASKHAALWIYDEFGAYLGLPLTTARRVFPGPSSTFEAGVWRRDFEKGIVMVNSTNQAKTISLGDGFETITGVQSPVNDGKIITTVTLAPYDGRVLLKRQSTIDNGGYANGSLVSVFSPAGQASRQGFFSYNSKFPGGSSIISHDLNADGKAETVVSNGPTVSIVDYYGQTTLTLRPYGAAFSFGITIAIGDVTGDGVDEIITAPQGGTKQQIKVFSVTGRQIKRAFRAYTKDIPGGVFVAAGDINGDGKAEIITGTGKGGGPQVKVFTSSGLLVKKFFVYQPAFRGGIRVAAGDLTNDGKAEIVTAPGPGGGPHIRIFSAAGRAVLPGFFAASKSYRSGLYVSVDDINHDGVNHIITSTPFVN